MSLQLAVASYIYIHHALKKKRKERRLWQMQLYTCWEVERGSSLVADLNFQSVRGLYNDFTRMSPSEFEFLINLIGKKNLKKGHSVDESHFSSRTFGTDAMF
jgi:sialic acid synthase SpsE